MKKIEYWVAVSYDSPSYSIRAKTRAEVILGLKVNGCTSTGKRGGREEYAPPRKVVVHYKDDWDLLMSALDGSVYEG